MTVIEDLSAWISTRPKTWSPQAIEHATHAIADTMGCIIAASNEAVVTRSAVGLSQGSVGNARAFANGAKVQAATAACINGTAAHALEIDDNFYPALTHASALSVPALIALAEETGASGAEIIDAYIVGLEVQATVSRGVNRSHYLAGWHGTGTIGCIGVAGASARLLGLSADETANALSLSVSMAAGVKNQFGAMAKPVQCGLASRNGIVATELARAGIEGNPSALEGQYGFLELYGGENPLGFEDALKKMDHPPAIEAFGLAPKRYACCGSAHKSLDCIDDLKREHGFNIDDIKEIAVLVGGANKKNLRYDRPTDGHQARFSMQYCAATLLTKGRVWLSDFDDEIVNQADTQRHIPLTSVTAKDIDENKLGPDEPIVHSVQITLSDDVVFKKDRAQAKGTIFDPFDDAERLAKFKLCCEETYDDAKIDRLWNMLNELESSPDVASLVDQI